MQHPLSFRRSVLLTVCLLSACAAAEPTGASTDASMHHPGSAGDAAGPYLVGRFAGMEGDRFVLRSITDEIMYELSRLSGQEYVDIYASSVKGRKLSAVDARAAKK